LTGMSAILLTLPILLPIVFGVLLTVCKQLGSGPRRVVTISALLLNAALVFAAYFGPASSLTVFRLGERLPVYLAADGMGGFFCALAAVMYLAAGLFSQKYMEHESDPGRFNSFFLITLGMLNGMGLAGNMITLYLFFEALTLLSVPLVMHTMTKEAVAASFKYLFYSIAGSSLALVGLFFVYNYGVSLEFTSGGVLDLGRLAGNENAMLIASMLAVVGLGAKAGMFPLHGWLPSAHPVAPSPASAILSGVITKAGVLCIIRFVFYLVGPEFLRGTWVQTTLLILALISIFMGSMLAYKEPLLKKRLAYSSISQVSYVLFGLFTLTAGGALGGLLHIVTHSIAKDALFLAAGALSFVTGKTAVADLRGVGRKMPVALWCFTLAAITLIGLPPTAGFLSKWNIAVGSLSADIGVFSWLGPAIIVLSALLTAGYLLPISISGFFPGEGNESFPGEGEVSFTGDRKAGALMLAPLIVLAALAILAGVIPKHLVSFFEGIVNAWF